MTFDHLTSQASSNRSPSANGVSRRGLLQAGAAAGGGLMLSLSLPFAIGKAEAADANGFMPNAFIRIDRNGQIVLTMPYVEMGQGTYTVNPDADRRRVGGGSKTGAPGTCSAERKALRQPLVRSAGNWQLERDTRGLAAPAPSRRNREKHAGVAAAKRWNVDPASCRAQNGEVLHAPTRKSIKYGELAADAARMPVPESVVLKQPRISNLSAPRPSVSTHQRRLTERPSMASMFGRRA